MAEQTAEVSTLRAQNQREVLTTEVHAMRMESSNPGAPRWPMGGFLAPLMALGTRPSTGRHHPHSEGRLHLGWSPTTTTPYARIFSRGISPRRRSTRLGRSSPGRQTGTASHLPPGQAPQRHEGAALSLPAHRQRRGGHRAGLMAGLLRAAGERAPPQTHLRRTECGRSRGASVAQPPQRAQADHSGERRTDQWGLGGRLGGPLLRLVRCSDRS